MVRLHLLSGPNEGFVHRCATRLSSFLEHPLLLRSTSTEESFKLLKDVFAAGKQADIILHLPWATSLSKWNSRWRHQWGHEGSSPHTLQSIVVCLCTENVVSQLEKNHLIDETSWAARFVESLETASQIIMDQPCEQAAKLCQALNHKAELQSFNSIRPIQGPLTDVHGAWAALVNEEKLPPISGVQRFLFSTRRPFDRQRLAAWLREPLTGLIRARGFFWVADAPSIVAELCVAGSHRSWEPVGTWWIGMRRSHWPKDPAQIARIQEQWHPDFGDRLQAIGCIGLNCDPVLLKSGLESCLLSIDDLGTQWANVAMVPAPFSD